MCQGRVVSYEIYVGNDRGLSPVAFCEVSEPGMAQRTAFMTSPP